MPFLQTPAKHAVSLHSENTDMQQQPVNHLLPCFLSLSFFLENEGKVVGKETEVTPKDVFVFLTGSDRIPPMGFERKGAIVFDHVENTQEGRLPSVSTCLPQLKLPVCDNLCEIYDVFKERMNLAVLGSVGFGNL